jgi:hypothetical protein
MDHLRALTEQRATGAEAEAVQLESGQVGMPCRTGRRSPLRCDHASPVPARASIGTLCRRAAAAADCLHGQPCNAWGRPHSTVIATRRAQGLSAWHAHDRKARRSSVASASGKAEKSVHIRPPLRRSSTHHGSVVGGSSTRRGIASRSGVAAAAPAG